MKPIDLDSTELASALNVNHSSDKTLNVWIPPSARYLQKKRKKKREARRRVTDWLGSWRSASVAWISGSAAVHAVLCSDYLSAVLWRTNHHKLKESARPERRTPRSRSTTCSCHMFRSVFKLDIVRVWSANALECISLEIFLRNGSAPAKSQVSLLLPFYSNVSFQCNIDPLDLNHPPVTTTARQIYKKLSNNNLVLAFFNLFLNPSVVHD